MQKLAKAAALGLVVAMSLTACGDDGDDGADDDDVSDPVVDDAGTGDADGELEGDDLVADFLSGIGLTPDIMSDEQHDCMNAELEAVYPDGFPDGFREGQEGTAEVGDAVDAAAETCGVVL